jgi:hypothetical protein
MNITLNGPLRRFLNGVSSTSDVLLRQTLGYLEEKRSNFCGKLTY